MIHKIIESGIIVLLVYTPLAFGGVTPGALAILHILSAGLLLLWLVQQLFTKGGSLVSNAQNPNHRFSSSPSFLKKTFIGASLLFLTFIYFQTISLPTPLVKILSPTAYALYSEAAHNTTSSLPPRLPLSVSAFATENEWAKLLAYGIVFFLITHTIRTRRQINRLIHVIFLLGCLEAVYGFLQFFSAGKLLDLYPARSSWVSGSFVNKNHFAGFLEMIVPLGFGLLLTQLHRKGPTPKKLSPEHFRDYYPKLFLLLLALFFMIATLLLSGSRGGIVSFSCGGGMFIILARQRRLLRRKSVLVLLFVALSIGLTIFLNPGVLGKRIYTFRSLESDSSFQVRRELWKSAFHIFRDYPINGAGLGSFTHLNPRYRTFRGHLQHYEYAENDYIQTLAETGIIGSALLLLMGLTLGIQLFSGWKRRRSRWKIALVAGGLSALFSLLIHSGTDFNLHIPSNALFFVTIAALCVSILDLPSSRRNGSRDFPLPSRPSDASGKKGKMSPFLRIAVLLAMILFTALFLFHAAKRYLAERQYQYAVSQNIFEDNQISERTLSLQDKRKSLERAVRAAPNNAGYTHALGKLLFDAATANALDSENITALFHDSESGMKQAIMLNPANPWFYYELGRMIHERDGCQEPLDGSSDCASAHYFLAALKNAPKEMFLREAVGHWFLLYDKPKGERLMKELAVGDKPVSVESPEISRNFARLLYAFRLDDEARQERRQRQLIEGESFSAHCRPNQLSKIDTSEALEFGNDAGFAEWKAPLANDAERIHKSICLPENFTEYRYSALKLYMNNGGRNDFTVHISVNGRRIKSFERTVPQLAKWYEIPFDKSVLEGRTVCDVDIRIENASADADGNFLQIWGESQTPNSRSTWNFETTEDLSSEEGIQQGEYLIRLVLKK